jgi:hypothetical protein
VFGLAVEQFGSLERLFRPSPAELAAVMRGVRRRRAELAGEMPRPGRRSGVPADPEGQERYAEESDRVAKAFYATHGFVVHVAEAPLEEAPP